VPDDLARVAYDSSLRSLDKQESLLAEVRARTAILVAGSSLAASFLGEPALADGSLALAILALLAFVVSIGASLYVLLPRKDLVFSLAGAKLYEELYEFGDDSSEVHRRLAYDLDRFWETNDSIVRRLIRAFSVAALALGVEIALFLASLAATHA
jgi:hypothetical protein